MIERGTLRPPSRQLADALRVRIESGEWAPGAALPSIVSLGSEYGVTSNTVQKALRILKAEGIVQSVPGYGVFVAERG